MKKLPKKIDLSIIILNYNSGSYLAKCLQSIYLSDIDQSKLDIIVPDNGSIDNSLELGKKIAKSNTQFYKIGSNTGFSAGNNYGVKYISPDTKYVLFLNVDTVVYPDTLNKIIKFFDSDLKVDSATCYVNKVVNNTLQPECHRGFPTPWNAFCHFFLPFLPKFFPKSKLFNGYFLGHLDYSKIQRIDCCVGAFFMMKYSVGQKVGWWNEKYFFKGEDLDFCYKLKINNFKLFFYPFCKIDHYEGVSSKTSNRENKLKIAKASTKAMRIFYQENLIKNYSAFWQFIVWQGINILEFYRLFKAKYL
jgi:hypothetical protein